MSPYDIAVDCLYAISNALVFLFTESTVTGATVPDTVTIVFSPFDMHDTLVIIGEEYAYAVIGFDVVYFLPLLSVTVTFICNVPDLDIGAV